MFGVSDTANDGSVSSPVEIPKDIFERVSTLCLALPEVTVRVDASLVRARSAAHSFDIRRRSFCLLVALEDPAGKPVPLVVLRADPDERDALLSIGHPFYAPRAGRDRIAVRLTDQTDWDEIGELVTESYRRLAPKKLTALLPEHPALPPAANEMSRQALAYDASGHYGQG
jgi:YjbR protein